MMHVAGVKQESSRKRILSSAPPSFHKGWDRSWSGARRCIKKSLTIMAPVSFSLFSFLLPKCSRSVSIPSIRQAMVPRKTPTEAWYSPALDPPIVSERNLTLMRLRTMAHGNVGATVLKAVSD